MGSLTIQATGSQCLEFPNVSIAYEAFVALPVALSESSVRMSSLREQIPCLLIACRVGCKAITLTQLLKQFFSYFYRKVKADPFGQSLDKSLLCLLSEEG